MHKPSLCNTKNNKMITCIYHIADLDGLSSAAIVKQKYKDSDLDLNFIGWNYGDEVPYDEIEKSDMVILVDLSFEPEDMLKVKEMKGDNFFWIDHHVSAINNSKEHKYDDLQGIRNDKYAACELTWFFFMKTKIPSPIVYLGSYDTFRQNIFRRKIIESIVFSICSKRYS